MCWSSRHQAVIQHWAFNDASNLDRHLASYKLSFSCLHPFLIGFSLWIHLAVVLWTLRLHSMQGKQKVPGLYVIKAKMSSALQCSLPQKGPMEVSDGLCFSLHDCVTVWTWAPIHTYIFGMKLFKTALQLGTKFEDGQKILLLELFL